MHRFRLSLVLLASLLVLSLMPSASHQTSADVLAPNWVIYDVANKRVLGGELINQRVPMASLTKMMTGLLASETLSPTQQITIVDGDLIGEANIGLQPDDTVSAKTLLHGLMMRSGNDAAAALARAAGGRPDRESQAARERFIEMMNQRASELDMHDTHFANPHGLDAEDHYSTARDLARLTEAAMDNPRLMQAFGARTYTGEGFTFQHGNQLPGQYDGVIGGKTGWTDNAGLCLIQLVERDGRMVIVVLLGSTFARWYPDAIDLANYAWTVPDRATSPRRALDVFDWWRQRTDGPVEQGEATRSWLWGEKPISAVREQRYQDALDGSRLVQYFDKGRMEINDPDAPVGSRWYVTGGHLARELITGNYQTGDDADLYRGPARIAVAGDPGSDGPTYADFAELMDGSQTDFDDPISLALGPNGNRTNRDDLADYEVDLVEPELQTRYGIASAFDEYLDQTGPVARYGRVEDSRLFEPKYAMVGMPITEPAWVRLPVGGVPRDVLVQCFERRCLTYTPTNPENWRVEMGNIGRHYLEWIQTSRIHSLYEVPRYVDRLAPAEDVDRTADRESGPG